MTDNNVPPQSSSQQSSDSQHSSPQPSSTPPSSAPSSQPSQQSWHSTQHPDHDPGRTLGIVGLILAIFIPLVGFIISIIAENKSRNAGYKNSFAKAGIIVGAILFAIGLITFIVRLSLWGGIYRWDGGGVLPFFWWG